MMIEDDSEIVQAAVADFIDMRTHTTNQSNQDYLLGRIYLDNSREAYLLL